MNAARASATAAVSRVEPPVVMMGMLKVGPQIRIEFKGVLAP